MSLGFIVPLAAISVTGESYLCARFLLSRPASRSQFRQMAPSIPSTGRSPSGYQRLILLLSRIALPPCAAWPRNAVQQIKKDSLARCRNRSSNLATLPSATTSWIRLSFCLFTRLGSELRPQQALSPPPHTIRPPTTPRTPRTTLTNTNTNTPPRNIHLISLWDAQLRNPMSTL